MRRKMWNFIYSKFKENEIQTPKLISQLAACLSLFKPVLGFYCRICASPWRRMTQILKNRDSVIVFFDYFRPVLHSAWLTGGRMWPNLPDNSTIKHWLLITYLNKSAATLTSAVTALIILPFLKENTLHVLKSIKCVSKRPSPCLCASFLKTHLHRGFLLLWVFSLWQSVRGKKQS